MKTEIIILVLVFIFLGTSCEKDDASPRWSKITALKDGELWEAKGIGRLEKKTGSSDIISFRADVANSSGHVSERIVISNIPVEIGKHELKGDLLLGESRIAFYHMDGDDVLRAVYVADEEAVNYIEIKNIDFKKMEIAGIFKASFLLKSSSVLEDPAEISFADGRFRLKIEEINEQ